MSQASFGRKERAAVSKRSAYACVFIPAAHWERKQHYFTLFQFSLCVCHLTFLFSKALLWASPNYPVFTKCCVGLAFRDSSTARQLKCVSPLLPAPAVPGLVACRSNWTLTKAHKLPFLSIFALLQDPLVLNSHGEQRRDSCWLCCGDEPALRCLLNQGWH